MDRNMKISCANKGNWIIYIMMTAVIFQLPLQVLLIDNIQYYILIFGIATLVFQNLKRSFHINLIIIFFVFVVAVNVFITMTYKPLAVAVIGAVDYLLPLVFWVLFYNCYPRTFDLNK
jgi:hypothetical protein